MTRLIEIRVRSKVNAESMSILLEYLGRIGYVELFKIEKEDKDE